MSRDDPILDLFVYAFVFILLLCGGIGFNYIQCHSKAEKQGMECSWGPIQGCMVKMQDGTWMDYNRLRYME